MHTESFTIEENKLIRDWFKNKYNLNFSIGIKHSQNNLPYLLLTNKKNVSDFLNIIYPFPPSANIIKNIDINKCGALAS